MGYVLVFRNHYANTLVCFSTKTKWKIWLTLEDSYLHVFLVQITLHRNWNDPSFPQCYVGTGSRLQWRNELQALQQSLQTDTRGRVGGRGEDKGSRCLVFWWRVRVVNDEDNASVTGSAAPVGLTALCDLPSTADCRVSHTVCQYQGTRTWQQLHGIQNLTLHCWWQRIFR